MAGVLALIVLLSLTACGDKTEITEELIDDSVLRATELKVNNLDTPLGIDTTPLFGWTNKSTTTGRLQTAYQIIVASTAELAAAHTADVWDTGKVESADSFDIPYAGQALTSCTDYYWSVCLWDENGTATDWTPVARFGTGMLEQSQWIAKWIGGQQQPQGRATAPAPMLRKGFELTQGIKKAKVYVCGLGLFELKVNGVLPDDSVLKPADTQYEDTVSYCAYDVTQLLQTGKNAVTVELGNGFYNLTDPISINFYGAVWRDNPKLLLELHVEYEDGSKQVIASDETWRCYDNGPVCVNSIYRGEQYDATMEVDGWTDADFDDSSWSTVRMADAPTGKLRFENMEPMRRVKAITPTVEQINANTWRVYAGEFCTGWAKISFNATKNSMIKIRYYQRENEIASGLYLEKDGEKMDLQSYLYRCKGVPGEAYEPKFSYAGYEIIEITGYSGELKPEDVVCYSVATDAERIGSFDSGNEMVNALHELMVRTMICNMQGKPTDTPIFEKVGWTGDFNGAIKTFNYNFDANNFIAHFVQNIRDTSYGNRINEYSPSGQRAPSESPTWTQAYVNAIYATWHEGGQLSLSKEHYDFMRAHADYWIEEINKEEPWIWEWRGKLGDWASPNGTVTPATMPSEGGTLYDTAAVYRVMKEMAEIATALGKTDDAQRYKDAADNIRIAFHNKFYNAEKGYYESGYWNGETNRTMYRQSSNLVALYYELCPEEYRETVLNNLLDDIIAKNYHLDVGHIGAELILPVLSREGYGDIAMKILMQRSYPSWGFWLELGSSTALEGWKKGVRSWCHYFLGTYDEWFYQNLAGIQNPRNGYETVTVRPEIFKELGYVNASVNTVRGMLSSSWKVEQDDRVTMSVTVPIGTTADILLPVAEVDGVQLNGAPLAVQTGVQEISQQDGWVLVKVISGTYNFDLGEIS